MTRRILLSLVLLLAAATAFADDVRGKVVHPDGNGYANVAVVAQNARGVRSARVYTGPDGMFQLEDLPAGRYTLEITSPRDTKKLSIVVTSQPYTDIAPVPIE